MALRKGFLLLLLLLAPSLLAAQPSDLFISEYIEGSSNNKAIEIYNATGDSVNLSTEDYVLQFYFNGSTSAGLTISLSGTVANGDVYVVAHGSANATILGQADQTNSSGWFNGDDAVVLRKGGAGGTIVDAIGQIGNDPGSEWGSGLTSTADNTLRRRDTVCAGDTNATDAFDPSVSFDGFATDNVDSLGAHTSACTTTGLADLLISEYIEGSSNNKAIEIYNATGDSVNLSTEDYVLQFYFNGSTSAGLTISLSGTVANGDVYVVAHGSANATILGQADQTNSSGWFNGDDAVVLRKGGAGGTIVDAIGQIGNDPGSEWGSGLTSTADNTLRRKSTACAGDTNATDAFDPSVSFDGFATDNVDSLGGHTASCGGGASGGEQAPFVAETSPADNATAVPEDADIVITFSEDVSVGGTWFTFETSGGSDVSATVSGGPATFTLDPETELQEGETYTVTIIGANVNDQDGNDPPDSMAGDYSFSFTVAGRTRISAIQGDGGTSPMVNRTVTIEGIVVGDFQENDGDYSDLDGFYVQEEEKDQDSSAATSEGIFVYAPGAVNVQPGDTVRVTGRVTEFGTAGGTLTELGNVTSLSVRGNGPLPTPVDVEFPFPSSDYPERFEGMYVRLPQELLIAEYFNFDRYNEIVLARPLEGLERPFQPTSYVEPGTAAQAVAAQLLLNRITLDDARTTQNPDPALHPNGSVFNLANRFRGGDVLQNVTGVLEQRFDLYRIQPTQGADYTGANPRTPTHDDVGGCLKVASFNVLNYFLTIDNGSNICGPGENQECRGADTQQEFLRQRGKILAALAEINADVFGLIEMENTAGVEPLADITAGLNDLLGAGTYDYIVTGTIGTDAIRVGIIYKPATVTPVGGYQTLTTADDPRFLDTKNRPSLAQTFRENSTDEVFTVVVNHLKSKGSDCNDVSDPDMGDGQGNCNVTRTLAAQALVDWLASDPTGSNDPDYLIIGDLNSYDEEDPINAIKAGADGVPGNGDDYTDLIEEHGGEFAYSYVFDGQLGYLDYALATKKLKRQVTGAAEWHINADEPDLLDYDMSFKAAAQDSLYEGNAYRASDHDPVVVGLDLAKPVITVGAGTATLWPANHNYHTFSLENMEVSVADGCDQSLSLDDVIISRVWSDEPENAGNDGNTYNDMVIGDDCRSVMLRAERKGNGNGRVYTIMLEVMDENGNVGKANYKVKVPVSKGSGAVNNGQGYFVEGCNPDDLLRRVVAGEAYDNAAPEAVAGESGAIALQSYPGSVNPGEIIFALPEGTNVELVLYDMAGKEVMRIAEGYRNAGTHRLPIETSDLAAGVYVVHLTAGGAFTSNRIVIAR